MPTINVIEHNGIAHQLTADVGQSVMQAVTFAGISSMSADCGGACACATCHGYLDETWMDRFPSVQETENAMLDIVPERRPNSRLSCQLVLTEEMDGLTLHLPAAQF